MICSANGTLAVVHGLLPVGRLVVAARLVLVEARQAVGRRLLLRDALTRKSLSSIFICHSFPRAVLRRLKLLGAVAGVGVEDALGELISRARRRGVGWLKLC